VEAPGELPAGEAAVSAVAALMAIKTAGQPNMRKACLAVLTPLGLSLSKRRTDVAAGTTDAAAGAWERPPSGGAAEGAAAGEARPRKQHKRESGTPAAAAAVSCAPPPATHAPPSAPTMAAPHVQPAKWRIDRG
jgi:hypothetical protein